MRCEFLQDNLESNIINKRLPLALIEKTAVSAQFLALLCISLFADLIKVDSVVEDRRFGEKQCFVRMLTMNFLALHATEGHEEIERRRRVIAEACIGTLAVELALKSNRLYTGRIHRLAREKNNTA